MKVDLELIFKIGSLAGLASLIYLLIKDLAKYFRQSRLKITFSRDLDLRTFTFPDRNWEEICYPTYKEYKKDDGNQMRCRFEDFEKTRECIEP
jgi:hypothetical protein